MDERTEVWKVRQGEPGIRLFMSDGSERSTYMPQEQALGLLGAPHSGVNLMSMYYPKLSFWPERRLFGSDPGHYRNCPASTREEDYRDATDGYYPFVLDGDENPALAQVADVRRWGQEPRLTVTADVDTPEEDLRRIAERLREFGPMQLRLNHEANGCTWFRFARGVGLRPPEERRQWHGRMADFFLRAHRVFADAAPKVTFVACYQGEREAIERGEELPALGPKEFGPVYRLPDVVVGVDLYGSLHYGWPEHAIEDAPLIGEVEPEEQAAYAMTPHELCEGGFRTFWRTMCRLRGEQVRIDLGELNFDEDIHGPWIQAYLVDQAFRWVRDHPEVVGSVTFYELTDRGGLGLFRQRAYDDLERLDTTVLLEVYRRIMGWDVWRHPRERVGAVEPGAQRVELRWNSPLDAEGVALDVTGAARLNLGESYWRRVIVSKGERELHLHGNGAMVDLPEGAQEACIFALPPDGRDNCPDGYRRTVPVPAVI